MAEPGSTGTARKSLGELLRDVPRLLTDLVRAELDALKAELANSAKRYALALALIATAAFLLIVMVLVLVAAAIAALALVLPVWAAALIVAGGLLLVGGLLGFLGVRRLSTAAPDIAGRVESVSDDIRVIKGEAPRAAYRARGGSNG